MILGATNAMTLWMVPEDSAGALRVPPHSQKHLRNPRDAQYCASRGFLRCFWECGGTLSAPALSSGTIHKVMAFVAPKIIGGTQSYTPVGNLGFVEMTQV